MTWSDVCSILQGALSTIALSLASIALGVPLGLGCAMARWYRTPILNQAIAGYVSITRATPAVTLALLIYFALPGFGLSLGPVAAALATLTLSTCAFNCEIWRGALKAFPTDQLESATAFGMRRLQILRLIVLPQAFNAALPALVNEMTLQVKSSPAIAVIGIVDITRAAMRVGARTYAPLPPFAVALVIYSLIVAVFVLAQRFVEKSRSSERPGVTA